MKRFFDFLRVDDLPQMTRPSFLWEQRYYLLWGCVTGAVEGNIAAIVAKKTFEAPDWLTSLIWSLPIAMNLLNLTWGVWLRGRRIVPTLCGLTACAAGCIGSVALTPREWGAVGAVIFAVQLGLTHFLFSGMLSLRVAIWRANYPTTHRGKITGRIQTLRFLVILTAGMLISASFDRNPDLYRLVYPAVAAIGLLALFAAVRLRIRGESRALAEVSAARALDTQKHGFVRGLREAVGILRQDRAFARYMAAQFLLGSANFFTDGVLVTQLAGQMGFGYLTTNLVMLQIPTVTMLFSIRPWSGYFDRFGVVRFRVVNSGLWLWSYASVCAAMLLAERGGTNLLWIAVTVLIIGRLINGICRGGGSLAWSLGHLHFAKPQQAELYMGIHVALTGVRGLIMPLLGAALNAAIGNVSFLVSMVLVGWALMLFRGLDRDTQKGLITPAGGSDAKPSTRPPGVPENSS